MRLVIEYSEGDGYTYCCTNTFPVEYESAEQLLVDIEDTVKAWIKAEYPSSGQTATFGKCELYLDHFLEHGIYYPPNIYTIDEWFEQQ